MKSLENQNDKKKSLIIFTPTLSGGVGRVVSNITNGLAVLNFDVTLLVPSFDGDFSDKLSKNIKTHSFNKKRTSSCVFVLANFLKTNKPDAILSLSFHANCIAVISLMISGLSRKTLCIISEHINLAQSLSFLSPIKRFIMKAFIYTFYRKADALLAVSSGAADSMSKYSGVDRSKISVINNPVLDENFFLSINETVNHPFLNNKNIPVMITVGRFDYQKDVGTLLVSMSYIKKDRPIRLIICGDGPLKNEMEIKAKELNIYDDIDFMGFTKNPFPYIKKSDVFVLSSLYEGLPTVLIEALAIGVPIVSTDCPDGPREILNNGEYGMLVQVSNPKALSQAIIETLDSKKDIEIKESDILKYEVSFAVKKYADLINNNIK
ncbi:MAG: glycosyltransferase [Bacteroidetes bacterium]|nr:glycosyltransferase [Bacteroidota bacterium]